MKMPVKIVLGLLSGLLLLVVIGLTAAAFFIDSLAKRGIEVGSTYALGVPTSLDKASIAITSGGFSMEGLKVDNPKGFDGKFMTLGSGAMAVSLGTLSGETVVLPKFQLSDLELDLERGAGGANYKVIMENLKRLESGQKPSEPAKPGKKFKINEVSITNVTVHVDLLGGPGGVTRVDVPIHEVKLTNVGSDGSGVDIPKLTSIILEAVLAAAVDKGGGLIPADVVGELQNGLSQLSGLTNVSVATVGKAGEQLTKVSGDISKAAQDAQKAVDELKKGIGDLLPGAKKPEKKPGDK